MHRQIFERAGDVKAMLNSEAAQKIIGTNYERYRELWTQQYEKTFNKRDKVTAAGKYNVVAIFLPAVWWAYRKLYSLFFGVTAIIAGLLFYTEYYHLEIPKLGVTFMILGLYANEFYFDIMVKRVKKYESLPEHKKPLFLKLYGGTSVMLAVLSPLFCFALAYAAIVLADYLNG